MSTWTETDFKALCAELGQRFEQDPAFRARALADAPAALRELAGRALPQDAERVRIEQAEGRFKLAFDRGEGELSDEELGAVVGGVGSPLLGIVGTALITGVAFGYYAHQDGASTGGTLGAALLGAGLGAGVGVGAVADAETKKAGF